ncbi:sensor histidine kinase [Ferruginibacter sp. HRS2-29]|uniref:sensor histidine kinase n=1 Tax=Ferruginibacter sp. HRS2-29 TaxID=2487334 RepID=UPI0020CE860D|nr:ATP-binding protein [Ferruginibacter sp. HRS2-29]MCP9753091.1 hypothetical protein [Ferruginibacter sp. HRS2-29]
MKPTFRSIRSMLAYTTPAAWLTSIYLTISILWILLSDGLAYEISNGNNELLRQLQSQKGLFFVILTSALIYYMSNRFYLKLKRSFHRYEGLEANYYALHEATREGIFDCDLETMKAKLNKKMQFFLPGSKIEIEDFWETYKKRVAPGDMKRLVKEFEEVIASTRNSWQTEYRLLGEDNLYYTVISGMYIIRNPKDNKALRLVGAIQDVSDLRNLQAEYYNEQINYKQKIATSIIEAQETEKNRWAEELHDNVCQLLSVAKLNLSAIDMMPASTEILTNEAKKLVIESISEIRQLSASIKPPSFEDNLLVESIETLTADISRVQQINFHIESAGLDESKLSDAHMLLIYRVVQEQLTNITKYSQADAVRIRLSNNGDVVNIEITDNGRGFDAEKVKNGLGLRNIQSRLQVYKGKMKISSVPGNGCSLRAVFNVRNAV